MTGIGRVLVIVYAIMALAATGRSFVQIAERFDEAPLAYTLSAASAVVYIIATLALVFAGSEGLVPRRLGRDLLRARRRARHRHADRCSCPELFAHPTVWSWFGMGYLFVPLVLPFFGIWWLAHASPRGARRRSMPRRRGATRDRLPRSVGGARRTSVRRSSRSASSTACTPVIAPSSTGAGGCRDRRRARGRGHVRPQPARRFCAPTLCPESLIGVTQKLSCSARPGVDATLLLRFDEAAREPHRPRVRRARAGRTRSRVRTVLVGERLPLRPRWRRQPRAAARARARTRLRRRRRRRRPRGRAGRRVSSTWIRELLAEGDVEDGGAAARPPARRSGARSCTDSSAAANSASRRRTSPPTSRASCPRTASTPAG